MSSGTVVISLDAELGWGFHDHESLPAERVAEARGAWRFLVDLLEEHEIPATWAVVGHLFLAECDGVHTDHPAGAEWFARDPGGRYDPDNEAGPVDDAGTTDDLDSRSNWFGRDLIDAIRDGDVDHEIGSHTFSHVEFGKPDTSREVAATELERSVAVAAERGIELDSLVFPRNSVGHRDLLRDHGFSSYRGNAPDRWYDGGSLRRPGKLATYALGAAAPPIVEPTVDEYGLVNVPASLYLYAFDGAARDAIEAVTGDPVARQVRLGLERLRDRDRGVFHLWLHPNNVRSGRDRERLRRIAALIAAYRDEYGIEVDTMTGVAAEVGTR